MDALGRLFTALRRARKDEPDGDAFADAVWLAGHMLQAILGQTARRTAESSYADGTQETTPEAHDTTGDQASLRPERATNTTPFAPSGDKGVTETAPLHADTEPNADAQPMLGVPVPAAPPLPGSLEMIRALRPLRRRSPSPRGVVIDEAETAQRIADLGLWLPVLSPVTERWLDLALVIDDSASMAFWRSSAVELDRLLRTSGVFRGTRVYHLSSENNRAQLFQGLPRPGASRPTVRPESLVDPRGRRLILIFTDAVSDGWYNGSVAKILSQWTSTGMTSLVSPLPDTLWRRTALGSATAAVMTRSYVAPFVPARLTAEAVLPLRPAGFVALPVVSLDPAPLRRWAHFFGRDSSYWPAGYVLNHAPVAQQNRTSGWVDPEDRVDGFWTTSSPTACRLACLLAASPAICRPVSRLIRETMAYEAGLTHEAEVFFGGILEVVRGDAYADPEGAQYDFHPGVRELLLEALQVGEAHRVLVDVSAYVERHFGKLRGFRAFVLDPRGTPPEMVDDESGFAEIAVDLLAQFGGEYVEAAGRMRGALKRISAPASPVARHEELASDATAFDQGYAEEPNLAPISKPGLFGNEIYDRLCVMPSGEFDWVVTKLGVPRQYLSMGEAPPATRAVEVLRFLEAQHRLDEIEAMLRASAPPPARISGAPPPPGVEVFLARLPATNSELFGREEDLAWLDQCWAGGVNVATIVAWGGVGKTVLVNAWLTRMRDAGWRGAERVFGWSFYSQGTDRLWSSNELFSEALQWFGDTEPVPASPYDKAERLARLIKKQRVLLVLDGVEQLQWGPGAHQGTLKDPALQTLVKELGAQNEGLCLITSRIALTDLEPWLGGKARARDLGELSPQAGAALLAARGAKGSAEELQDASIEYRGHGLALTLLGSYLKDVAAGDVRVRSEIGPLEDHQRQGAHARRVMKAYAEWLEESDLAILKMIGLFDRPAEADEIAALRAEPSVPGLTDALAAVDRRAWNLAVATLKWTGLLSASEDHRLDAHPLVREHFGEELRHDHPEAWREGHRRLYEHLKTKAKELPENVEEMAPLYAAVMHACLAGRNQEAFVEVYTKRIVRGHELFNAHRLGAFGSQVAVLSAFFDPPWEQLAPGLDEPSQGSVLLDAGFSLRALGRLQEAQGLLRQGLEQHVARARWRTASIIASNLGELLQARGNLSEALEHTRKSVEYADTSADPWERAVNRIALAARLQAMGLREHATVQLEEAEHMLTEALPAFPLFYSFRGYQHRDLLLDQGRDAEVRERATKALDVATQNHWLLDAALAQLSLGLVHLLAVQRGTTANFVEVTSYLEQAVKGLRRAGHQELIPLGLLARATVYTRTLAFDLARISLNEALSLATRCGLRLHEADAHLGYARLALAEGHRADALPHLAAARNLIEATGYHRRDEELASLETLAATSPERETAPPPLRPGYLTPRDRRGNFP